MKLIGFLVLILAGLFLPFYLSATEAEESPTEPQAPDLHIEGGLIRVAELLGDEDYSRAAYSPDGDQYLVVLGAGTNNGDIKGRYIDARTGELLGEAFNITSSPAEERYPDVVYDANNDRFLVVFEKNVCEMVGGEEKCNYAIHGVLLHGKYNDSSPFAGSEFIVAHEHNVIDLREPRTAYNADNGQYLVVFKRGTNAVHGQMLDAHSSSPSPFFPTFGFQIRMYFDGSDVNNPDAAWGSTSGTFLVVWQNFKNYSEDGTIQAKYLHDTFQDGGSQVDGYEIKVAPYADGPNPLSNDCGFPKVAFNPITDYYTVVFRHRTGAGIYQPSTLHTQLIKPFYELNSRKGTAFPVETDMSEENIYYRDAEIDYSGMGDTMFVVYIKSISSPDPSIPRFASVYARRISGSDVSPRMLIRAAVQEVDKYASSVVGTRDGRALLVWSDEVDVGITDTDVVALRLAPYWQYLPAMLYSE